MTKDEFNTRLAIQAERHMEAVAMILHLQSVIRRTQTLLWKAGVTPGDDTAPSAALKLLNAEIASWDKKAED